MYNQLLLYLSVSYDKVFSGLSMLASKDTSFSGLKDLKTAEHMVTTHIVTSIVLMILTLSFKKDCALLLAHPFTALGSIPGPTMSEKSDLLVYSLMCFKSFPLLVFLFPFLENVNTNFKIII